VVHALLAIGRPQYFCEDFRSSNVPICRTATDLNPISSCDTMPSKSLCRLLSHLAPNSHTPSSPRSLPSTRQHGCHFSSTPSHNTDTYRRTVRRLANKESPSFKTHKVQGPSSSHVIFNPPPSAPNVYHTPIKFLPPDDPRRKMFENAPSLYNISVDVNSAVPRVNSHSKITTLPMSSIMTTPGTALREVPFSFPSGLAHRIPESDPLPRLAQKPKRFENSLTQQDVDNIRALRAEDPEKYTVNRLAKEYGCTAPLVFAICRDTTKVTQEAHFERLEKVKDSWGKRRNRAWEARLKRKEFWKRDA